jgi:hypothetical protein
LGYYSDIPQNQDLLIMAKTLYPYTLQPVPFELSEAEQRSAQLAIWRRTNQISQKTWIILGVIVALAIAGLVLIKNYSTVIFWLMIIGVVLYVLVRRFGMEWYVKRKLNQELIEDIKGIRMGVQQQGLTMIQRMGAQEGRGLIAWSDITEWQDHPNFLFLTFKVKGQQGAHILPKRMNSQNFSFETIRRHLNETVGPAK